MENGSPARWALLSEQVGVHGRPTWRRSVEDTSKIPKILERISDAFSQGTTKCASTQLDIFRWKAQPF